jgi:hypothetical protein
MRSRQDLGPEQPRSNLYLNCQRNLDSRQQLGAARLRPQGSLERRLRWHWCQLFAAAGVLPQAGTGIVLWGKRRELQKGEDSVSEEGELALVEEEDEERRRGVKTQEHVQKKSGALQP